MKLNQLDAPDMCPIPLPLQERVVEGNKKERNNIKLATLHEFTSQLY